MDSEAIRGGFLVVVVVVIGFGRGRSSTHVALAVRF